MSTILYQYYRSDVIAMACTTIVKHSEVADAMNEDVVLRLMPRTPANKPNPNAPETWKYYKNMAGEYHALDRQDIRLINQELGYAAPGVGDNYVLDEMIIFIAGDNGPKLANFNLSTIGGDVTLANEYRYGTLYYKDLVRRYPEHEHLIVSILNPVPPAISLPANDGDILYCGGYFRQTLTNGLGSRTTFLQRDMEGYSDRGLIEDNESNLLGVLQEWFTGMVARWHNRDYCKTDDLYFPTFLGMLYTLLPATIMNIRLANCHTNMVHSYHVREFLESHGHLAKYIPALPLEQTLFLYRNVRWIEANVGKQETFDLLVDRLATPCGVPLSGYRLRHSLTDMPQQLFPTTMAAQEVINFRQLSNQKDIITVEDLLRKEINAARGNPSSQSDITEVADYVRLKAISSPSDDYPTKVIESVMIDLTDRKVYRLSEVLLNHWLFCASRGTYTGTVFYTNPLTGARQHITPKNAAILFFYALNKSFGQTLEEVPTVRARLIPRSEDFVPSAEFTAKPDLARLKHITNEAYVSDEELNEMFGDHEETYVFTNTKDFYDEAKLIYAQLMNRYYTTVGRGSTDRQTRLAVTGAEDYMGRGQLERAMGEFYWWDVPCVFMTDVPYSTWFALTGVDVSEYDALSDSDSREMYRQLALELAKQATGDRKDNNKSLRELQRAVVEIMRQFSSYAVQYVSDIQDIPVAMLDPKPIRYRVRRISAKASLRVPRLAMETKEIRAVQPAISVRHVAGIRYGFTSPSTFTIP